MPYRCDTSGNIEDQYQTGSDGRVLKNKLEIADSELIDALEQVLLSEAEVVAVETLETDFQFTKAYIYQLHFGWLGDLYEWAGRPRTVSISKGGILFCPAENIDGEMDRFEREVLAKYTPCNFDSLREIAHAMAIVHGEFEIIHPFREGNGRLGRLIASLMANQAGLKAESLSGKIRTHWDRYIEGLREAWNGDYDILTGIFEEILFQEDEA